MDFDHEQESFTYMIGVENRESDIPESFVKTKIPASTWAVFEVIGPTPEAIQNVWQRIFAEWFPATGYEHADAPELEVYPPGDTQDDRYRCEIWVPILKK